jgi:hypothetical protein
MNQGLRFIISASDLIMVGTTRLKLATSDVTGSPTAHPTRIFNRFRPFKAAFIRQKP